jgi:hypothetical protein
MSAKKPLYMESTEIPAERTAQEIQTLLAQFGARQIVMDYGEDGKITGMHFLLIVRNVPYPFKLPVRTEPLQKIFEERRRKSQGFNAYKWKDYDRAQAERVAWRQLLMWIKAQFAMVDAEMVQTHEVFAPYLLDPTGKTLFEYLEETRYKAMPPPAKGA